MEAIDADSLSFSSNAHSLSRWSELSHIDKIDALPGFIVSPEAVTDSSFYRLAEAGNSALFGGKIQLPDWLFAIFILSFVLIAIIQFRYYRYIELSVVALFNRRRIDSLYRNIDLKSSISEFLLFVNYLLIISVLLFLMAEYAFQLNFSSNNFFDYWALFAFISFVYFLKLLFIRLLGNLFSESELAKNYVMYVTYHNRILGLFFLPLVFIFVYSNLIFNISVVYTLFFLFFAVFSLRLYRGSQIFIQKDVSIVYLILYLCALEILPLLLILKAISNFS